MIDCGSVAFSVLSGSFALRQATSWMEVRIEFDCAPGCRSGATLQDSYYTYANLVLWSMNLHESQTCLRVAPETNILLFTYTYNQDVCPSLINLIFPFSTGIFDAVDDPSSNVSAPDVLTSNGNPDVANPLDIMYILPEFWLARGKTTPVYELVLTFTK